MLPIILMRMEKKIIELDLDLYIGTATVEKGG